jgi:hypothetical protein
MAQLNVTKESGHFWRRLVFGFGEVATSHDFRTESGGWEEPLASRHGLPGLDGHIVTLCCGTRGTVTMQVGTPLSSSGPGGVAGRSARAPRHASSFPTATLQVFLDSVHDVERDGVRLEVSVSALDLICSAGTFLHDNGFELFHIGVPRNLRLSERLPTHRLNVRVVHRRPGSG